MKRTGRTLALPALAAGMRALTVRKGATKVKARTTYRRKRPTRTRRSTRMPSYTLSRRRKTVRQDHSTEMHQINLSGRARQPSAMTLAMASLEEQWYRVSGLSQVDTSTGFLPISTRTSSTTGAMQLPVHVWDITSLPNSLGGSLNTPTAGYSLYQQATNIYTTPLASTKADGTFINDSKWIMENTSGALSQADLAKRKMFHYYTHIKLNLYGVRKRTTKYIVQLLMVKDVSGDFITAAPTNTEKKKIADYLARPLLYNNLNSGDPQTAHDLRVVKQYECLLGPTKLDDYGAEAATPHIQTVNWFVPHNRLRRYDWRRYDAPPLEANAAFDAEVGQGHDTRVDPKLRLYLVIRALSPEPRTVAGSLSDYLVADPISEPSYDYVIRNKWAQPC